MAEVDPDQEAACRGWEPPSASSVLRIVDHDGQDHYPDAIEGDDQAPPG